MKFPTKFWRGWSKRRNGVDHVRAGGILPSEQEPAVSLLLKGRCEVRRQGAVLHPGDMIEGRQAGGNGGSMSVHATMDSTVLRLSRETLHRLAQRWPINALWSERSAGPGAVCRVDDGGAGGKAVGLMPLSAEVPCADFAMNLAETISSETGQAVLRLQVEGKDGVKKEPPTQLPGPAAIFEQKIGSGREGRDLETLARRLEGSKEQFPYVIVEVARETCGEAFGEILRACRAVYPVLRQNGESLFELNLLIREAVAQGLEAIPIKPLVYLKATENAHGLSRYIETTVRRPVHFYLREAVGDDVRLKANLRRLGREICGRQVGLALSSGAARGLSHIGVIQVLEENGIEVDVVAGSSLGAYIASIWGAGYGGHELEKFARELEGYRGFWRLMDVAIFPRRGFLLTKRVRKRLERTIGDIHFSDLARPVRVVATRLDTLEKVIFSAGSVVDAVLASVAIPGVCVPVTLDGVSYVDGGICDPLPVSVLTAMGIQKIIAVNTIVTPEMLRARQQEVTELERKRHGRFSAWINPFASGNAFDTLMRSIHAAQTQLAEASCRQASVVLRPYTLENRWRDFGNPLRYIQLGREEARAKMPAIRALIDSPIYENDTSRQIMAQAA